MSHRVVAEDGALHLDIKLIECKMAKQSDAHLEKAMAQIKNGLRVLTKVFRPKGSVSQSSDNGFFWGEIVQTCGTGVCSCIA